MAAQALLTCTTQREAANKVGVQENRISVWKKDPQFQAYMDTLRRGTVEQGDKARQIATKSLDLADRNVDALRDADPVTGLQGAAVAIRVAKDYNEGFGELAVRATPTTALASKTLARMQAWTVGVRAGIEGTRIQERLAQADAIIDRLRAQVARSK
jgi:sulfate adenylyltransferase subunit 1 (EFTu-like GTPase family)